MIVVGCPVQDRSWVLPTWFEHVERAARFADVEPFYVFVGSDPADLATVSEQCGVHQRCGMFRTIVEPPRQDRREWSTERLHHMVQIRNMLLSEVRGIEPDHFLSLDSDILLHESTIFNLLETSFDYDAVGGKTYMNAGFGAPSYAMMTRQGGMRRSDTPPGAIIPVDVIMAIKLMTPVAYNVDYVYHRQGEDIGFCLNAKANGLKLGFDGRVVNKHVMKRDQLSTIDPRCGY